MTEKELDNESPYAILKVSPNASPDEVTAAYRKMAQLYHPDKVADLGPEFHELAERRMKAINIAAAKLRERGVTHPPQTEEAVTQAQREKEARDAAEERKRQQAERQQRKAEWAKRAAEEVQCQEAERQQQAQREKEEDARRAAEEKRQQADRQRQQVEWTQQAIEEAQRQEIEHQQQIQAQCQRELEARTRQQAEEAQSIATGQWRVEAMPAFDWVTIPAGEFVMGSDKKKYPQAKDDELPRHEVYVAEFQITRVPVTVAQFAAFVEATGYRTIAERDGYGWVWNNSKWEQVKGTSWRHPWGPDSDVQEKAQHPVTQSTWYDACAYCHWLSKVTGISYCLPTEAEWEKAARGTDGRTWPWGDTWDAVRCNTWQVSHHDTTIAGSHPRGASPYGVLDMSGNVWEWTSSLWGSDRERPDFGYPYTAADGREDAEATGFRVVRGGSWNVSPGIARCAARYGDCPLHSSYSLGFRVVSHLS